MENINIKPIAEGHCTTVNLDVVAITDAECAIILGQIHYWLELKKESKDDKYYHDGCYWVYNSVKKWKDTFPCFTEITIKRKLKKLRDMGILVTGNFNSKGYDRTNWYTISYDRLNLLLKKKEEMHLPENDVPLDQNDPMDSINLTQSKDQNDPTNTIDISIGINIDNFNNVNGASQNDAQMMSPSFHAKHDNYPSKKDANYAKHDDLLLRQIAVSLYNNHVEDKYIQNEVAKIITYFYRQYRIVFGHDHVTLKQETMDDVVAKILEGSDFVDDVSLDTYRPLIDEYFDKDLDCDYHLPHFLSGHVRDYRWYDIGMGGIMKGV